MSQVMTHISAAESRVIDDYVGRMRNEYQRLERQEVTSGLIESSDDSKNRRNAQVVAAWDGESKLEESAYFKVRYREMSASGFTFWLAERPTSPYFVLIVQTPENSVNLKARVIDVQSDTTTDEVLFIVKTEFEGTI